MTEYWYDEASKTLIYPGVPASTLPPLMPDLKQISSNYFAVPLTLRNAQLLRWQNYPVVPIVTDESYDWPIARGLKPLPHQRIMVNFSVLHPRMFNLSSMGTMKTLSTLWAADFLMKQHPKGKFKALIVAPLSTLNYVWGSAIFKNFFGRRTFSILHGSSAQRSAALDKDVDFYIVNFDGVGVGTLTRNKFEIQGFSKELMDRADIQLAIVDEASAHKDHTTKRHRIARKVFGAKPYLWLLSGSPTPNAPTDAYGLAKLVNNAFGKSFKTFQMDTMEQITQFKWLPRRDGYEKARQILSPSIRYALEDVWDGPEMTIQMREVELTDEQKKLMLALKKDFQLTVKSGKPITAANEAAARQKFIQISLGAIYDENHSVHFIDASPRLRELRSMIDEATGKILIFAPLTSIVEFLYKQLDGYEREIVNGNTSQKDRTRIFGAFQSEGGPRILIADPGTMAHGLDLWMARSVFWYGPIDKAEIFDQANHRAYRPGQRFPVNVVQLASNTLEREIFRRLENNLSLQGTLLDMIKKGEI